jgi:hypothetical protein
MKFITALVSAMCVTMPTAGNPLRESTLREAARLAGLPQKPSADSDWSRARKLKPGTAIVLVDTSSPAQPRSVQDRRHVIQTDDSSITVLNLTHIVLPPQVRGSLRDLAEHRPEWFLAAERGRGFLLQDGVRIGPAGVLFAGRKVADLQQVLDRIAREDVLSIAMRRKRTRGSEAQMVQGAVGGFLLTMVGASGGGTGPNFCTDHPNGCWPVIGIGSIAGAGLAYIAGNGRTFIDDVVVYRAP